MSVTGAGGARASTLRRAVAALGRAAGPVALVCAVLAPLAVHWLTGKTLVWFDTARLFASARWMVDEALRAFRLPLWNPFVGGGMPLLADTIHGVLHPVSVLAAWLGTDRSADVLVGGYVACAALGAAWLARELGASGPGAALAGVAYGLSGFVLSMAGNLVFLAGAGSLPLCVAGLRRFAAEARADGLVLGAAGAAVLALSGDVQALAVGGALGLVLAWEAGGWRGVARAAGAGAVGLLVAAVQLVPSAVHFLRSDRAAAGWAPSPLVWAFEPWRVAELVLPGLLWGPDPWMDPVYASLAGPGRWFPGALPLPFVRSVFVGLVPLTLALAGAREGRRGRVLAVAGLVLLWIALGPALGASAVLGHVPIWKAFRYPEKLVGPLSLVLAVLAGLGADALAERRIGAGPLLALASGLTAAALGLAALEVSRLGPELGPEGRARVVRGAVHLLCAAGALGGVLALRRAGGVARAALVAAAWLGAVAAAPAALRPGDPAARLHPPGPALDGASPPRVVTPYEYPPLAPEHGRDGVDQAIGEYASKAYVGYNVAARVDSLEEYGALIPARLARLKAALGPRWPAAARRYAATHVVVDPPRAPPHQVLHALATEGGVRADPGGRVEVWRVPHRPWASFAREVRAVTGAEAALEETVRAEAEHSPRAVVEGAGAFGTAPGEVLAVDRGLESVLVEAETSADATLIVAEAFWPGWEATLDGAPVPIFCADALVRAVRWPAGRHVLELRYRPPEVGAGLALEAAGLAVLAAWAALLARRRRRQRTVTSTRDSSGA